MNDVGGKGGRLLEPCSHGDEQGFTEGTGWAALQSQGASFPMTIINANSTVREWLLVQASRPFSSSCFSFSVKWDASPLAQ